MFGFNDIATLAVYYNSKNRKIVPVLSSLPEHNNDLVSQTNDGKPQIIMQYNQNKGGVDQVDRLKVNYSISRTSRRWTLTLFFMLINIAGINSHILYKLNTNTNKSRKEFLKSLMIDLVHPQARRQIDVIQRSLKERFRINDLFPKRETDPEPTTLTFRIDAPAPAIARGKCYLDTYQENRMSTIRCAKCRNFICTTHRVLYCTHCNEAYLIQFLPS